MQVVAADLADFPGAPFSDSVLLSVVAELERVLGWHVAPSRDETLTVDGPSAGDLKRMVLPSRYVTVVTEVRDVSGDTPVVITGWRLTSAREGVLYHPSGWGQGQYEVDVTHGYELTPPDLLPQAVRLYAMIQRDPSVVSESAGPFSVTLRSSAAGGSGTLWAYAVHGAA
jgi:hypothetical protein